MHTILRLLETETYVEGIERGLYNEIIGVVITSNGYKANDRVFDEEELSYIKKYVKDVHNTLVEVVTIL